MTDVYPGPDVLMARLPRGSKELAETGLRSEDLLLVAERRIPDDALRFDRRAQGELARLVPHALRLPAAGRQQLREFARSLPELPRPVAEPRPHEQYPPGFGSLLVRMLALRNLGWTSAAKVMARMSGVYLAASTIGAVGRGVKELDATLLNGFAAVLGVRVEILGRLTGVPASGELVENVTETAALLWEVRHLSAAQVREVSHLATVLGEG